LGTIAQAVVSKMYVSAGRDSQDWTSYTVQLTKDLQRRLLRRVAWDRMNQPDLNKIALAHYVSAALAVAPSNPDHAMQIAEEFRDSGRGRGPKLYGTGTRVHGDVASAMSRMEALLRIRRYGMFGLFTAASVTRLLDELDSLDPITDPDLAEL
jgi:hypothetical protein